MSAVSIGSDWVGRVVDGRFTLERWLGGAGQSGVFLTSLGGDRPRNAAVKLIPADAVDPGSLLNQWTAATRLTQAYLMRLIHTCGCRVDGRDFVYAVTEYSEEILVDVLPVRPLTSDEVRQMLDPVLSVLSWLHAQGFVHGGLKPSNIMVVDERLKVSIDRVQPVGPRIAPSPPSDIHDAPESVVKISPASDIWSLGVLLVEAFTQRPPQWDGTLTAEPIIPAAVPQPYADIARACLRIDPAQRCTLSGIKSRLAPASVTQPAASAPRPPAPAPPPPVSVPAPPTVSKSPPPTAAVQPPAEIPAQPSAEIASEPRANRRPIILVAALLLIAAVVVVIVATRHSGPSSPAATAPLAPAAPTGPIVPGAVLHRALPAAPQDALDTIRGRILVIVRAQVDASGNVSDAAFDRPGPSHYFASLSLAAAHNWKFRPAQARGRPVPSTWDLEFGFAQTGIDVSPIEKSP